MKQQLVSRMRQCGLLPAAEQLRLMYHWCREAPRNRAFVRLNRGDAFPPTGVLYDAMSSMDYRAYFESGARIASVLYELLRPYLPLQRATICEWGCGPARIIRHLRTIDSLRELRLFGTDYNTSSIEWCQRAIPEVTFCRNQLAPPLPFEADSFDALYCVSVFTHLSESMHHQWIDELFRVVRRGGVVLLTTHGDNFRRRLLGKEAERYDNGELVVRGKVLEGSRMYTAFQSPAFMRRLLDGQQVLLHDPQPDPIVAGGQDVWIVRKTR